nr:MAG TPA: hypothetical protein [Caudoviricetes sp.]
MLYKYLLYSFFTSKIHIFHNLYFNQKNIFIIMI